MSQLEENRTIGKTDIRIPPLGIGAMAWGDRFVWSYGRGYGEKDIKSAFLTSLEAGITFVDTAEIYGLGRSERYIGKFLSEAKKPVVIATKFFPFPWRLSKGSLLRALRYSLRRLKLEKVDLYQVHSPSSRIPIETWADALAETVQIGLARAVGVSNYNEEQMRRAFDTLATHGIPLASNQVVYNLIDRRVEFGGLLKTCKELGISLIAYSPLAQGVLTGKYTPDNPPPGLRGQIYRRPLLERAQPLIRLMREISDYHQGKTPAQVALNWVICKGAIPIPGAKNARQAQENAGAMGWSLSEAEVIALDEMSGELT